MSSASSLARPVTLSHGPAWANPIALAPLTNTQSNADGTLSDDEHAWLVARARGGFGLTMTCAAFVAPAGQAWAGQLGVSDDRHLPGLTRLADGIRAAGGHSAVQLHHGGQRADAAVSGVPLVAPWEDDAKGVHALTTGEVEQAVADFVAAAVRCERAGLDGVEVHGAHGYLVGQFLDGRKNTRTDGWGGDLAGRSRFLFEVVHGIRAATGPDFQVGLRLTPERHGIELADGVAVAGQALACGLLDYVDISLWDVFKTPHAEVDAGDDRLLIDHFTALPRHDTRLGVAGTVTSAADVAWCLDRGADVVFVGTGAILHHDFAARAAADPAFAMTARPVTRDYLAGESVGSAFVDYLAAGWDDFVA